MNGLKDISTDNQLHQPLTDQMVEIQINRLTGQQLNQINSQINESEAILIDQNLINEYQIHLITSKLDQNNIQKLDQQNKSQINQGTADQKQDTIEMQC